MTPPTPERWTVEDWATVAIASLPPGWVNMFDEGDGRITSPCPAVLLQELRATTHCRQGSADIITHTEQHQSPYETRVVYADLDWLGGVEAACEVGNYVGTEYRPGAEVVPV